MNETPQTPSGGHAERAGLPCASSAPDREVPAAPSEGPTTDCPTCGRTAKECDDSKARGWDNCCQTCDQNGHVEQHRLRMTAADHPASDTSPEAVAESWAHEHEDCDAPYYCGGCERPVCPRCEVSPGEPDLCPDCYWQTDPGEAA